MIKDDYICKAIKLKRYEDYKEYSRMDLCNFSNRLSNLINSDIRRVTNIQCLYACIFFFDMCSNYAVLSILWDI